MVSGQEGLFNFPQMGCVNTTQWQHDYLNVNEVDNFSESNWPGRLAQLGKSKNRGMVMKASPVTKPLGFVKEICQAGHTVVFDDEGSFIMNKKTGEVNCLREEDGNYMLDAWIAPPPTRIQ